MDGVSAFECLASSNAWLGHGHDLVVDLHGVVHRELLARGIELHRDRNQPAHQRHEHDAVAVDHLGVLDDRHFGRLVVPRLGLCSGAVVDGPFHGYGVLLERHFHWR